MVFATRSQVNINLNTNRLHTMPLAALPCCAYRVACRRLLVL